MSEGPHSAVLGLHSSLDWPELTGSDDGSRSVAFTPDQDLPARVAVAAEAIEDFGAPMHIVASGPEGAVAVRLAVSRPELVRSLVLTDCSPRTDLGDVTDDLVDVRVPSLVVAASPDGESGLEDSQTLAGQIPNGVFVVMDHTELPAHASRPGSFQEWSASFISIVEGLRALDPEARHIITPADTASTP
ncbi:alpha/beta fold hydrolase [Nocardioides terrisoli]|uniref:alpha/beta fold hydrolase n=1 Tax=Nocardioides terrisoli TaxID=3388267 RepID=UPI00287BC4F8|nr:hypothetical protein [Nocardioides marmorisolisilvae]